MSRYPVRRCRPLQGTAPLAGVRLPRAHEATETGKQKKPQDDELICLLIMIATAFKYNLSRRAFPALYYGCVLVCWALAPQSLVSASLA